MNETNLSNEEKSIAAVFALQRGLEGLARVPDENNLIMYNDIIKYVMGAISINDEKVVAALNNDLRIRRIYIELLHKYQRFYMPKAAAAASDTTITERDSDNFSIKLVSSRSQKSQFYVILILKSQQLVEENSELVLHVTDGNNCARCNFPPLQDGRAQVIVDESDVLFSLLTNVDAEIFIQ